MSGSRDADPAAAHPGRKGGYSSRAAAVVNLFVTVGSGGTGGSTTFPPETPGSSGGPITAGPWPPGGNGGPVGTGGRNQVVPGAYARLSTDPPRGEGGEWAEEPAEALPIQVTPGDTYSRVIPPR